MLFLERVAVTNDAPGLRGYHASFKGVVADVAQINLLLLVPKAGGVVLQPFQPVRIILEHLLVHLLALGPLAEFEVALSYLACNPASLLVA